jgi:hypothetical protein
VRAQKEALMKPFTISWEGLVRVEEGFLDSVTEDKGGLSI